MSLTHERVDQKADRLARTGRVTWTHGVAVVAGDADTYIVRRVADRWTCSCRWATERPEAKACSHVLAAALTFPVQAGIPQAPPKTTAVPVALSARLAQVAQAGLPATPVSRCPECRAATNGRFCTACGWVVPKPCTRCGSAPAEADPCDPKDVHGLCGDCRWTALGDQQLVLAAAPAPKWDPFAGGLL